MKKPRHSLNFTTKGVGRAFPQHQAMLGDYDYNAQRSIHRLPMYDFPSFEPDFTTVLLHGHSKLTDLISTAPIPNVGLLVSSRLRKLFEAFKLPPHRYYSVPMSHRGKAVEGYSWLHLPQPSSLLNANSTEDVEAGCEKDSALVDVALLKLYRPSWMAYCWVNTELRNAIESAKITGIKFG
jgi:hypothetical protein